MNPLTQTLNQVKINEKELEMGLAGTKNSWHQEYKASAWVFLGGLPYEMTEGDIICMFSQYGEPVSGNISMLSNNLILCRCRSISISSEITTLARVKASGFSVTWTSVALS